MSKGEQPGSALIIVDVQNDFCPGGALAVPEGDRIIPVVNRISSLFPRVVATQDWHSKGHVSFASSHPGRHPYDRIDLASGAQVLWPDHCIQGSRGADFHPHLDLSPVDLILRKGASRDLDSYSAFLENDHATPTGLEHFLKGMGIQEVVLCGLATDFCVFYSAMDALRMGFSVTIVTDAVRGVDVPAGGVERAMAEMVRAGARLADGNGILARSKRGV